jgi:hypothetical protein
VQKNHRLHYDDLKKLFQPDNRIDKNLTRFLGQIKTSDGSVSRGEVIDLLEDLEPHPDCNQGVAMQVLQKSVEKQIRRNESYCALLLFIIFFMLYLVVVYDSNAAPATAFEVETALKKQLLIEGAQGPGGMPGLSDS